MIDTTHYKLIRYCKQCIPLLLIVFNTVTFILSILNILGFNVLFCLFITAVFYIYIYIYIK